MNLEIKNDESNYIVKQIGSTLYKVKIVFSENAKESMEEKVLRMIKNDIGTTTKRISLGISNKGIRKMSFMKSKRTKKYRKKLNSTVKKSKKSELKTCR